MTCRRSSDRMGSSWTEQAAQWGIETGYFDVRGQRHEADDETLRRIVEATFRIRSPAGTIPRSQWPGKSGLSGRRTACLGAGGSALRGALAAELGPRRFHRSGGAARARRRSWRGGRRAKPAARAVLRPAEYCSGSPYAPNSRLFLNPLYIDVEAIEEFRRERRCGACATTSRGCARPIWSITRPSRKLKFTVFGARTEHFTANGSAVRRDDFEAYRKSADGTLQCFAAFETLRATVHRCLGDGPENGASPPTTRFAGCGANDPDEIGFHEFLQWNAERQIERCRDIAQRRRLSIGLYLDTAVGVDAGGADAWMEQGNASAGTVGRRAA